MMQGLINALAGKKTYIVAAMGILGSLLGLANGDLTLAESVAGILGALSVGTLRAGVKKDVKKVEKKVEKAVA